MAENTKYIDLVKPGTDEFYDVNVMNSNLDKIDSYTGEIKNKIDNGSIQNTALQPGYNRIQIPEIPVSPKIEFTGFSYVNLLGRDGNCEDVSKFSVLLGASIAIDNTSRVFGNNSVRATSTVTSGSFGLYAPQRIPVNSTKCYLISGYVKCNGGTNTFLRMYNTSLSSITGVVIPSATPFTRIGFVVQPSHLTGLTEIYIGLTAASSAIGNTLNVDGIMINEITVSEASLSVDQLMAKYPYVDSYACLTNPYFENRRYNLVRNGNCEEGIGYWKDPGAPNNTVAIVNGKIQVTSTINMTGTSQQIIVKPNTNYYISANLGSNSNLYVIAGQSNLKIGTGSFNTGNNSVISVALINTIVGIGTYNSVMLVEGTTAPTEYKSCDLQRFVLDGQFTADDKVTIENGKVSGLLNWKHRTLYGKDFDFIVGDSGGHKGVWIPLFGHVKDISELSVFAVKYDGKILKPSQTLTSGDQVAFNSGNLRDLCITVADTDSGWNENIDPNNDETKAFMNGWRALQNNGTRYNLWVGVVGSAFDKGNYPPGTAAYTATTITNGGNTVTVDDITPFAVGNVIGVIGLGTGYTISSISGNVITITGTWGITGVIGCTIAKVDTNLLNYCKANVAPGYEGYRLHYKHANPETITDTNVHISGGMWDLVKGDNYVTVDSGIVLGEVANPIKNDNSNEYVINALNGLPSWSSGNSQLINRVEYINALYSNHNVDTRWLHGTYPVYYFGKDALFLTDGSLIFNPNATYTVDYQILKTLHAQTFGSLSLSYPQSIISTLEGYSKALETKQQKDSALDTLIDLSLCEYIKYKGAIFLPWLQGSTYFYLGTYIPFKVAKKAVPIVKIVNYRLATQSGVVDKSVAQMYISSVSTAGLTFEIRIGPANTAVILNIKSYGAYIVDFELELDCRGRI